MIERQDKEKIVMKPVNLLNGMIGSCTGIFVGHIIYFVKNIELYKLQSIAWYEDLFYWGIAWLVSLIVLTLIKSTLKEKTNKKN